MARRSMRSRFGGYRNRARVVYRRARSFRPRSKKNKTLLIVGALAVAGFLFKDKISALLAKK